MKFPLIIIIRAGDTTVPDARGKSGARVCSLQRQRGATGDHPRDNNEDNDYSRLLPIYKQYSYLLLVFKKLQMLLVAGGLDAMGPMKSTEVLSQYQ